MSKRLDELIERRKQLDAQITQLKARQAKQERARDTRRKILVGAYYLDKAERENQMPALKRSMDRFLTRDSDRALFDLEPLPKEQEQGKPKSGGRKEESEQGQSNQPE